MFFLFGTRDIGIDLGTANTLIYMKGKGIILREPSVVAVDIRSDRVVEVGQRAKDVLGRTPGAVEAIRPLKDGVIADFDVTASMLKMFINNVIGKSFFFKTRIVICVPSGVTAVEKRAVREAALAAGGKYVAIVEEPMAAAVGAGLPVSEAIGNMVVDIGGGTSEVAVVSMGGIVESRSVRVAGDEFDRNIINYVKKKYNVLIGERTAEEIKIAIGSAYPYEGEENIIVKGRDLADGFPQDVELSPAEIREALSDSIRLIIDAVRSTLEHTPPELSADIIDRGITLTGGGALLRGLDQLIANETGMPVYVADAPLDCVALGAGMMLEHPFRTDSIFTDERHMM